MNDQAFLSIVKNFVPLPSLRYCYDLWLQHPFQLVIKKKRNSVLGDYTFNPTSFKHTITINGDLNPYSFLITYLHEIAHLITGLRYGYNVKPHGEEWKNCFKEIVYPILKEEVFPPDIIHPLFEYIINPKATSCSDIALLKALSKYDTVTLYFLSDVKEGTTFRFNKKYYVKESVLRTRAICMELKSKKKYYVPLSAQIEIIQYSMFS
ncbi:MAG: hypothetical protein NZ529_00760 [Cytophagaceae bacterium]|nr:hypothetical protein [Cytophagaceae bacterium]MDW8455295.1 hypothetical protein [Cytophagaceae bacterium]